MPRLHPSVAALLICLAAPAAWAQGTISSGTTFLSLVGTPFGTNSGNANLLFGSSSAFGTEQLFRTGWAYNQGVGTSNRPFSTLDTPTQSYVGNVATLGWSNAGAGTVGFARWNAQMTMTLVELAPGMGGAPGQARVDTVLTFTSNLGNVNSITFNLFNDLDLDIIGAGVNNASGDTYSVLDNLAVSGRASDASGSNYGEFLGVGAARYEFNTGSALRTKLGFASGTGSGNLATLAGASAPNWASTDGAVAMQWTQALAPGQSFVVQSSFTINTPVPEPATWMLMLAGAALTLRAARRR